MTRSPGASRARPRRITAGASDLPEALSGWQELSAAALAKRLRGLVGKSGVWLARPEATAALLEPALACGAPVGDRIVEAALRLGPAAGPGMALPAAARQQLSAWLKPAVRRPWRGVAQAAFGVASGAPGKPPANLSLHDREGGFASLRRGSAAGDAAARVAYGDAGSRLTATVAGHAVLDGMWDGVATRAGVAAPPVGPWAFQCWSADEDGTYLELRRPLADGAAWDRQLFLARHAPWLFLCDTVHAPAAAPAEWRLSWDLPCPAGPPRAGLKHRATRVAAGGRDVDVVPLWLPMDPLRRGGGSLRVAGGRLLAEAVAVGASVALPLALVWADDGALPAPWWTALTVTNDRRVVGPDDARAYRVQAGGKQCVAFRTLRPDFRTAWLGHQTFDECLIGWLNPAVRGVEAWLRIE